MFDEFKVAYAYAKMGNGHGKYKPTIGDYMLGIGIVTFVSIVIGVIPGFLAAIIYIGYFKNKVDKYNKEAAKDETK